MAWPPVSLNADKELARYVIDEAAQTLPLDLDRQAALRSRDGLIALARALYEALARSDIRYALERFEADARVQHVRPPEAILGGAGEGTCLDLVLLYAGLALGKDLLPLVVVLEGHALVAVSLAYTRYTASDMGRGQEGGWVDSGLLSDDGSTLRDLIDKGQYLAIECTGFAASSALPADVPEGAGRIDGRLGFEAAVAAGRAQLALARRPFRFAIDVAVLRDHHGVFAYEAPLAGVTTPYRHRLDRLMAQARETLFGGRGDELAWLDGAVAAGTSGHVFVSGESGSGKTALLANWVRRLLERPVAKPGEMALRLAYVFINRDAELADQPAVLHLLCHQLLRAH
ncbi:MAG TPA: hypothetical protein VJ598_10845, partial [Albitalea sp.]|nr:hypothetical protein [Albitalea sp.]